VYQKELEPRIKKILHATTLATVTSILVSMENVKLVAPIPGNDWELCSNLTQEGFNQIVDATRLGLTHLLKQARINLPSYIQINENVIANSLVEDAGLPLIRKIENQEIEIKFVGPQPLIKQLNSYLDPQKYHATQIRRMELNPIALVFESPDHLN